MTQDSEFRLELKAVEEKREEKEEKPCLPVSHVHAHFLKAPQPNFLHHFCLDNEGNYTTNSTYEAKLNNACLSLYIFMCCHKTNKW